MALRPFMIQKRMAYDDRKKKVDFCTTCRKDTAYTLKKQPFVKIIKEKEYTFSITAAVCDNCGSWKGVPGLIDKNVQEMEKQYRACESIASVHDMEHLEY